MVYAWEFNTPEVGAECEALGGAVVAALEAFMDALVFDPMDYARTPNEPTSRPVRILSFGGGRGIVTVQVYEPDRIVLVLRVQWPG